MISTNYKVNPNISFGSKKTGILKAGWVAALVTLGGCNGPFQKIAIEESNIPQYSLKVLNSLKESTAKTLNDTSLEILSSDTLELSKDMTNNPDKFLKKLINHADLPHHYLSCGKTSMKIKEYDAKTVKPVIKEGLFTNKSNKIYIPVDFYGKYLKAYRNKSKKHKPSLPAEKPIPKHKNTDPRAGIL